MEKTVLVVIPAEERHKEKLERAGKGCRFVYASPQTATEEMIEAADVIIGNVKPDRLHAAATPAVAAAEFCRRRCLCEAGDFKKHDNVDKCHRCLRQGCGRA